jgi:diguanylate cyclase (GGDEF)-like protein/PAS domain S-box-containing protein
MTNTEEARLAALREYEILGTVPEPEYDQITQLAAALFEVPIALVTLVDRDHQWLKARTGLDVEQTTREVSFCSHTIRGDAPLVVPDAFADTRFAHNSLVQGEPHIRFYAGAPLIMRSGHRLGALCLIDTKPRLPLTPEQERILQGLAGLVVSHLELRRLQRSQIMSRHMAEALPDAMVVTNERGRITFWNSAAARLFGFSHDEVIGQPAAFILPDEPRHEGVAAVLMQLQQEHRPTLPAKAVQVVCRCKDGSTFPAEVSPCAWEAGEGFGAGAIIRNISERLQDEERLYRLAYYDDLTGFANRALLQLRLEEALRRGEQVILILIGIDGFEAVNDSIGQDAGDRLLRLVAERLIHRAMQTTLIARSGGTKFTMLVCGSADPLQASVLAEDLQTELAKPYVLDPHIVHLSASIGLALASGHDSQAHEVLSNANLALQQARTAGQGGTRMFTPSMRSAASARQALSEELYRAWKEGEFELHYQPQVRLQDGTLIGAEALLRWRHPERGLLLPGAFLTVLETHQLAPKVGSWVLAMACAQAARWREVFPEMRIAVNLFAAQFHAGNLVEDVVSALAQAGLPASALDLEVTENIALQQDEFYLTILRRLHGLGVQIALDDFGTGYASLSMLQRLPLHRLKVDRSFVQAIEAASTDRAIVQALLAMSRSLGLVVVAEGIETDGQAELLTRLGCQEGQGYRFGKPIDAEAFTRGLVPQPQMQVG